MRTVKWLDKHFEECLLVFFLVLISCVMMLQVFMRYVLNNSLTWPEEFCRYCYVWTAFMSLGYTIRQGNMLRVAVVMDLLPQVVRKIVALLVELVCLVFFAVFFFNSIDVVKAIGRMNQTSTAMGWPMNIVYLCTVIGFGLAALRTLQSIYMQLRHFGQARVSTMESVRAEAQAEAEMAEADLVNSK